LSSGCLAAVTAKSQHKVADEQGISSAHSCVCFENRLLYKPVFFERADVIPLLVPQWLLSLLFETLSDSITLVSQPACNSTVAKR